MWTIAFTGAATAQLRPTEGELRITAARGISTDLLSVLIGGPVLAATAAVRGHGLLHSSAVSWPGLGAVGIVGPTGAGKSSVARLLVGQGRTLLSDDALRVDIAGYVRAHRGTTGSRLRHGRLLAADERSTRRSADGRFVVDDQGAPPDEPLPLLLRPLLSAEFSEVRVRDLPAGDRVVTLAESWPLGGLHDDAVRATRLSWAARLITGLRVQTLEVPWTSAIDPRLGERLVRTVGAALQAARSDESR